jgi:hypothetical protein
MTLPEDPKRGGYKRTWTDGTPLSVGLFIKDHLPGVPHQIYIAYKEAVQSKMSRAYLRLALRRIRSSIARQRRTKRGERVIVSPDELEFWLPTYMSGGTESRGGMSLTFNRHPLTQKQHCCSYNSFMHYVYMLKRLGLVEDAGSSETAAGKSGSPETEWHEAHPSGVIRETAAGAGSTDWVNFQVAYRQQTG